MPNKDITMACDLSEFYNTIPKEAKEKFESLSNIAINLGYKAKRDKVKHIAFSFISSKYKNGIMRFISDKGEYKLKLKFYGANYKNENLLKCLKETIEEYDFRYTGCYNCGKCITEKEGYIVKYYEGKQYFRCGSEYIDINSFEVIPLNELETVIREQTKYYEDKWNREHRTTASTL